MFKSNGSYSPSEEKPVQKGADHDEEKALFLNKNEKEDPPPYPGDYSSYPMTDVKVDFSGHPNGVANGGLSPMSPVEGKLLNDDDSDDTSSADSDKNTRHTWGRKTEYVLSMIGYCVGLGNVWRFPYVCIRNGGGAFLIPFFICLTLCGLPLYLMEVALGQFVNLSPLHVFNICPLFKGIGISMNALCIICSWYYTMILAWSLIYLVYSCMSPLPWTRCDGWWNTENCVTPQMRKEALQNASLAGGNLTDLVGYGLNATVLLNGNDTFSNSTLIGNVTRKTIGASEEFWLRNVLQLSDSLADIGTIPWQSGVALLVASIIVFMCIVKGVKTVGKVVYVTATLPYLLLTAFLIKGATLPGAGEGVLYYLTPDFNKLLSMQTWVEASLQVFYSLGPCWGGLITMASYNKFSNNCMRDAIILTFVCEGTSVFAGFAIFTVLGHMSYNLGVPIANFSNTGPGLAFVVYPEAISYLPVPQLWGVMFFIMLFTLGLDSQFVMCEVTLTTVNDLWPKIRLGSRQLIFKSCYLLALFLISLPYAAKGGMYLFQLVDWYFAAFAIVANGLFELIAVHWIYGSERFMDDIKLMIGYKPHYILVIFWRFITPLVLLTVIVTALMAYDPPVFQDYIYSSTEVFFGWLLANVSFAPVPLFAIFLMVRTPGSFLQRLKKCLTPNKQWEPSVVALREQYHRDNQHKTICPNPFPCVSRQS
ncbi:sodium- and chloride-dependent betaine transporter [Aplysia californica]|uniref:Transporter n=1 Tax=Aplysia californica TaxID=6500 RepID=A0ABM0ZWQ2_APLCA|nr:sodium- and chloride-dependent betaine transporter [Aplysia californica]